MSTIKSSDEHLTLNADGSSKDIKFQANGVEKASISSAGAFTSTTIDATKLTGDLPAISGAALTGVGVAGITSSADATAMTITSAEKIGIGTTSPSVNVHIVEDASEGTPTFAGATHFAVQATASSSDNVNASLISGSAGVSRLMFGDKDDEDVGKIEYSNSTNAMTFTADSSECLKVWNNSSTGAGFTVGGTYNDNGSDKVYSCHIENNVIGHRNVAKLTDAQGHFRFFNPNGQVGHITTSSSSTIYSTSSDYRLKENVDYTWDATTRLKQLKPARFNFIADDTNTLVDGFLAHEVSSVVPEAISGAKDAMEAETFYTEDDVETQGENPTKKIGDVKTYSSSKIDPQGIDQSKLVPLLVKTIQELEARITALEA